MPPQRAIRLIPGLDGCPQLSGTTNVAHHLNRNLLQPREIPQPLITLQQHYQSQKVLVRSGPRLRPQQLIRSRCEHLIQVAG
jgi:hypothetical protein